MKNLFMWKLLLGVGIMILLLPFIMGFYNMMLESWSLLEWLILYSYVYWPTYVVAIVIISVSVYKMKKGTLMK